METVGIDVSAGPARTVACQISWRGGTAYASLPIRGIDDEALLALVAQPRVCGIDVPFGWPSKFVETVVAYRTFAPLPGALTDELTLRATDRRCPRRSAGGR